MDLLTIGMLVSIVCVVAVFVTGVMTFMKLGELIRELRMAHKLEDEKKEGIKIKNDSINMGAEFIVNNPIAVIDDVLERKGHFSHFATFSLACTFFEHLSYVTLRKKEGNKKGGKIEAFLNKGKYGPTLHKLITRLKNEDIITSETFDKMMKVKCVRNKIVHSRGDISRLYKPTDDERLQIETAKECILLLLNYKPKKKD